MRIDLHTHTRYGSPCSYMDPGELVPRAKAAGLDAVCITEHNQTWDPEAIRRLSERHGILVIGGIEVTTDCGDILVFGLHESVREVYLAADLRRLVDAAGGAMIIAHPFRPDFAATRGRLPDGNGFMDDACRRPVFPLVDAVETLNGLASPKESAFAAAVSERLGLPGIGGSDAHAVLSVGRCFTVFDDPISSEDDLVLAIKRGRCRAALR